MKQAKTVLKNMLVDFDVRGTTGMDFFNGEDIIMNYGLIFGLEAMVKF